MSSTTYANPAPVVRETLVFYAPVSRPTQSPTIFDPTTASSFNPASPPAPWISLGAIEQFQRKPLSKAVPVLTGVPATVLHQSRESVQAQLTFQFLDWTKLSMALATGSQHMNVLATSGAAAAAAVGAQATTAVALLAGSTSTALVMSSSDAAQFSAGQTIAVDVDYSGQTGWVGSPITGAYVRTALSDVDYIRRVTFNIAQVASVNSTGVSLVAALPGGAPAANAKAQIVTGFVDREGGLFYQEWSALFVMQGSQGESVFLYYPRLQSFTGAEEATTVLQSKSSLSRVLLKASCIALPVTDSLDGERVVCYRSYLPAANAQV